MKIKATIYKKSPTSTFKPQTVMLDRVSPLTVAEGYVGDLASESATYQATTSDKLPDLKVGKYNMIIEGYGDLKIIGWSLTPSNVGGIRKKFRYTLTLNG